MKKLEGLKFLQQFFPEYTVDCVFVNSTQDLTDDILYNMSKDNQIWRVRAGRKYGSELSLPQGSFRDPAKLREYLDVMLKSNPDMEFVIHRVSPEYFSALFVGTIACYNSYNKPGFRIELQRVTKELVNSIDSGGKRPRDWDACLILDYEYLSKAPKILKKDAGFDVSKFKESIMQLYEIGEEIFNYYDRKRIVDDTYTRFNIYNSGQVLLDDHRSASSFIYNYNKSNSEASR